MNLCLQELARSSEVVAAGLNVIGEICRRQQWAMGDLLGDLIGYRKSKDKGVMGAARGLLQLDREVNPSMLKRREWGKAASMGMAQGSQSTPFGYVEKPAEDIGGLMVRISPTSSYKINFILVLKTRTSGSLCKFYFEVFKFNKTKNKLKKSEVLDNGGLHYSVASQGSSQDGTWGR
jgi:SDA1